MGQLVAAQRREVITNAGVAKVATRSLVAGPRKVVAA